MGVVEAKLAVKKDDATSSHPPRPSNSFMEAVNGELASLKLQEKPADGVGAPEIAAPDDDDDHHKDPESPNKGEEEAEKVVWPRLPQRPDEPDCAYYTKTGTCKFGLNCKFNHPPKRRRHRAKSKKQPEDVQTKLKKQPEDIQAAKEECEGSGSKMMGQTTHKVDEKERKVLQKSFRHENVQEKQKGTLLKKVEQNEKKAVEEQTRIPSKRMEQEDYKAKSKRQWKAAQAIKEEHEESRSKMVVQTACKVDENEKEIVHSVMQLKCEAAEEKQILPKRMEQEDNKAVEEKQMLSERMEHQDNKAAKEKGKETTSGKAAPTECKFYTMPGGCKFGKSCKYVHPQKKIEVGSVELNFLGLPIRPGEKECSYYMRTGNCKFATNCKYHHPDPTVAIGGQDPFPVPQSSGSMQQIAFEASPLPVTPFPTQGTFNGPTSFIVASPSYSPGSNLHSQGFHSIPECNGYQVHIDEYPERPGQPECQYFLRNGVCKFRSACKFHHPKAHLPAKSIGTFIPSYPPQ